MSHDYLHCVPIDNCKWCVSHTSFCCPLFVLMSLLFCLRAYIHYAQYCITCNIYMQHTCILSFPLPSLSAILPLPLPHTDEDTHVHACTQSHVLLVSDRDSHRWTAQSYTYTIVTAHMVYSIHMPLHIHIDLHTRSDTKVCHLECVWNLLKCKKRQTITNKHTLY